MADLAKQVEETAALLRHRKGSVAQQIQAGVEVPTGELLAISKLETRLSSLESFLRLAELTKEPVPLPREEQTATEAADEAVEAA